jgi:hypothetical protein
MSASTIYAHAIAQVEDPLVGIHLLWMGPRPWVYSAEGWFIQRRKFKQKEEGEQCVTLNVGEINELSRDRERQTNVGMLTLHEGPWPSSVMSQLVSQVLPTISSGSTPISISVPLCKIFTLELNQLNKIVFVEAQADSSFAIALHERKVVATGGPGSGLSTYELRAISIDTVVLYTINPSFVSFCISIPITNEEDEWKNVPYIVKELQLPLQQLMPSLTNQDAEFEEAKRRLLAGESIDENDFKRFANTLRGCVDRSAVHRPLDQVLLTRNNTEDDFEELTALDPIRILLPNPRWRRILGFGWFDSDPSLEVGETYEYRITGYFPTEDINDTVYGFHTIPSNSLLPSEFYLSGLRFRLPQPVIVELSPSIDDSGLIKTSRRGIRLHPQDQPFWIWPSIGDWSVVIDFPAPVMSAILELGEIHELEYVWGLPWGQFSDPAPVPNEQNPRLDFPIPILQLRLRGKGFLFSVRIPAGPIGLKPISVVLPPVSLIDTPRPEPPLTAGITNLQQPQPVPVDHDTPPSIVTPRHDLGFEIKWRPALRGGLSIWPQDQEAAPPLDAAIYQLEHRQLVPIRGLSASTEGIIREFANATNIVSRQAAAHKLSQIITPEFLNTINQISIPKAKRKNLAEALSDANLNKIVDIFFVPITQWEPLLPNENWMLGNRNAKTRNTDTFPGIDLMTVFPEVPRRPPDAGLDVYWRDVFDFGVKNDVLHRQVPPPGTYHQYRIAAIDQIGRPSLIRRETNILRLEKHVPPPVPVGPSETPADRFELPQPTGVQVRILVKNAPDLTADDLTYLGPDDNAIILTWGWHEQQRRQDPYATEFRMYLTKPLDSINGSITSVTTIDAGVYSVVLDLERPVTADCAQGSFLESGYPFYIRTHTGGSTITLILESRVPDPSNYGNLPEPTTGPIVFPLHFTPNLVHPKAWSERIEVQPIIAEKNVYTNRNTTRIANRLLLTPSHPTDSVWIGVSSADDQSYVPDQFQSTEPRSGNESGIVPMLCTARYRGRPVFDIPPPLAPVPIFTTPEPYDRPITFMIDLSPYLDGTGLTTDDLVRPERVSADALFESYYVTPDGTNRIMARVVDRRDPSEAESEVIVPNPDDRTAVIAALNGNRTDMLEDRFVVFLAGSHPYRDRLFEPSTERPVLLGPFQDTLPAKASRYVYRVRKGDAAGHISAGGAVAKVIVRVPSLAPGAAPEKLSSESNDGVATISLLVAPEHELTHLLSFSQPVASRAVAGPLAEAELLRIPNAHNLYPDHGILLRAPDGTLLTPNVKALADDDVTIDENGFRHVAINFTANAGDRVRVWTCTLTRDGIPSVIGGPWSLAMHVSPLPIPTLTVIALTSMDLMFSWSWPVSSDPTYNVAIEKSIDGTEWKQASRPLPETATSYTYTQSAAGDWKYRLRIMSPDGRTAYTNTVTPEA